MRWRDVLVAPERARAAQRTTARGVHANSTRPRLSPPLPSPPHTAPFFRLPCARVATDRQGALLHCALHLGGGSCISLLLFSGVFGRVGEITAREAQTAWPTKKKSIEKRGEGREPGYTEREDRRASESASAKPPPGAYLCAFFVLCFGAPLQRGGVVWESLGGEPSPPHTPPGRPRMAHTKNHLSPSHS